jgi:hydrogenase nickel incorporation protein HypA/HybF
MERAPAERSMHEMSIVLSIFDVITKKLADEDGLSAKTVEKITVQVGKLSTVVPEALDFAFEMGKKGTIFGSSRLEIKDIPISIECRACNGVFTLEHPLFTCPSCASVDLSIQSGRELFIESIELADVTPAEGTTRKE